MTNYQFDKLIELIIQVLKGSSSLDDAIQILEKLKK